MNLANKLQPGIWANGFNGKFYQKVEYEGIGTMCFGCGKVGHRREMCPSKAGGHGDSGNRRTGEHVKQAGSGEGSSEQQLGSSGRTDQVQSKKIVAPVIKTEGGIKANPAVRSDKGKRVEVLQEVNGGNVNFAENVQRDDDYIGSWIQVPPRRRRSMRTQGSNKENVGNKQNLNIPKQVNLNKIQAPDSKLKPTHKGARKKQTGNYLRSLIRNNEVVFVGLVETMVEDVNRSEVDRLIGNEWDFIHFPAVGLSGGLLALWRRDVTRFELITVMDQVLIGSLVFPNAQKWIVAVVYACKDYHGRRTLWDTIGANINAEFPVIVGGDFNCCLDQCEKKGGKRFKYSIGTQEMDGFLVDNDLHDLGFLGPKFTWSNNKIGNSKIWVRLDRVLMNTEGLRLAPLSTVRHLLRIASDHCPLLLNLSPGNPRPRSKWIRFEDIWMTYTATWKLVWKNWKKEDYGLPADVLNRKCQRTLKFLFFWSRNRIKELEGLKDLLEGRIQELQMLESSNVGLSEAQDLELRKLVVEFYSTLAQMASGGGREQRPNGWRKVTLIHTSFILLLRLEDVEEISEQEVRQAVFSMGNNRAPGIDCITSSFLKFYWEIVKTDANRAILHFFDTNSMCKSWKDTLVVLIPKTDSANQPSKFRPISLCQSFYKVIAKIIINRMKPVLSRIISEEQGEFVPGRSISSHGLIAQEIMSKFQYSAQKEGMMALKVDMEQAYDCMS
ncbi:uncharacterized protein LOC110112450 [Dendrobium catenatum]|uniref:uncharacterized protein LOC110112450 n=1 Tax=Dendrobium catenatum TaxID=906689 RepID=UPI0009F27F46|nr:uncharacterized protein LOC110112450 [Dendrobium catenatum]